MSAHPHLHYYVINLPECADRKERLIRRLKHHQIEDKTQFITAISYKSPLLNWFESGLTYPRRSSRPEHACFLSHLKALRAFVDDPLAQEAIILEDDAMLHNNFHEYLSFVLKHKGKAQLIMLSFLAASWDGVKEIPVEERTQEEKNYPYLCTITPKIFGAVAYWIDKDYARLCLSRFDLPLRYIPETFVTSELITRLGRGFFVAPPLVAEEAVYSTLRQGNDLEVHRNFYAHYGIENYSQAEEEDIKTIWKPIGYNPLKT